MFADKQILFPNKLVLMTEISKGSISYEQSIQAVATKEKKSIKRKFHEFELSYSSKSKIIKKVNWLFQFAKPKHIKTYSGKELYNFKVNFITLTLPSKQVHPTSLIMKECFERFLNEMRSKCKMVNYVWRLEFQKNGNCHFHIVTDTYIDYFLIQKTWNRIINYLGYVDRYAEKMSKIKFHNYVKMFQNKDFKEIEKTYIKNRALKWKNPNSVDVKNANNSSKISSYISKYFSKANDNFTAKNELDNENNSFGLRLWFSSRSLAKLETISEYIEAANIIFSDVLESCKGVKKIVYDYCTVIYFNFSELSYFAKRTLNEIYQKYRIEKNYVFSD